MDVVIEQSQPVETQGTEMAQAATAAPPLASNSSPAEDREAKFFAADTSGVAVINHDSYDLEGYDQALSDFPKFNKTLTELSSNLRTAPALLRDIFFAFNKRQPMIAPPAPLKPAYEINRSIIEQMMKTIEYKQVREAGTCNDPIMSSIATMGVAERAIQALGAETTEKINELADVEREMAKLFALSEALEESAARSRGKKAQALFERAQEARAGAEEAQAKVEALSAEVTEAVQQSQSGIRQATRRGLQQAEAAIDATNEALKAYSGGYDQNGFSVSAGGAGGMSGQSPLEKLQLANKVSGSEKLKQIAEMTGRLTRIALSIQKSKVKHPPDEIASITTGNDISHLLASELALLADPDLENLFIHKFFERGLQQYELIHHEPQGRGPIILAIDESGSMTGIIDGITKEVWAKGVGLALMAIARHQKRDIAIIHFSSRDQLKVELFEQGKATPQEAVAVAEFFYNGGTAFEPWMEKALELIEMARFDKADVICVTDGLTAISPQVKNNWLRIKAAREMRAYGILIGTNQGAATLASITDAMLPLDLLKEDMPVLEEIFAI